MTVMRHLPLVEGDPRRHPAGRPTPERLKRARELPLLWEEQRTMLGVDELEGGELRRRSGAGREAKRGEVA